MSLTPIAGLRTLRIASVAFFVPIAATHGQSGGNWQTLAPMPTARQELSAAVLNGKVYAIAGFDGNGNSTATVEVYNPPTNRWTSAQPIPVANNHNNAAVAAGRLYTFAGLSPQTFVYDAAGNSWSAVAPMSFTHGGTAAVGVLNDKIYVAGGTEGGASLRELEMYDPAANTWTRLAPMSVARNHTGGAFINGKFYVVGGRGSAGAPTALEVYDPQTNSWANRAPMPTGRSGVAVAGVNGELWVFGGEIPTLHAEVEAYNPSTNSWRRLPNMPTPRHGISAAVIGNRVYLPGGGIDQNIDPSGVNEVFTIETKGIFANISSRLKVETGDNVLIGGFIVRGSASKRVIIRAPGPSVPVAGALGDPLLELYDGAGQLVATNDNWPEAPNKQEIVDSTLAPSHPLEPAILTTVAAGNHTAVVRGAQNSTGIALIEVYDLEPGGESKLANISTRGFVQTGDNILIGGLIVTGNQPLRVIVRALGPSLPVPQALANPTLELRDSNGALLAANNDWRTTQAAEITATTLAPGNDLESAIVQTLSPANYTAIVRGADGATGVGLVEAYAVP